MNNQKLITVHTPTSSALYDSKMNLIQSMTKTGLDVSNRADYGSIFIPFSDMLKKMSEIEDKENNYRGTVFGEDWVKPKTKNLASKQTIQLKALQSFDIPVTLIQVPIHDGWKAEIGPAEGYEITYYEDKIRDGMVYKWSRLC